MTDADDELAARRQGASIEALTEQVTGEITESAVRLLRAILPADTSIEAIQSETGRFFREMANKLAPAYPSEGDPWADFLHHRMRVIEMFAEHGHPLGQMVEALTVDEFQVRLLLAALKGAG